MLTSKERAALRKMANQMQAIIQVGKLGIEDNLTRQVDDALTARELIKVKSLETAPVSPREIADELALSTGADIVQVVGRSIVLWRKNFDK